MLSGSLRLAIALEAMYQENSCLLETNNITAMTRKAWLKAKWLPKTNDASLADRLLWEWEN